MTLFFVSHLNVIRMLCDRIIVLRSGEIVESARSQELFAMPRTPYSRALLDAIPTLEPEERAGTVERSAHLA